MPSKMCWYNALQWQIEGELSNVWIIRKVQSQVEIRSGSEILILAHYMQLSLLCCGGYMLLPGMYTYIYLLILTLAQQTSTLFLQHTCVFRCASNILTIPPLQAEYGRRATQQTCNRAAPIPRNGVAAQPRLATYPGGWSGATANAADEPSVRCSCLAIESIQSIQSRRLFRIRKDATRLTQR